MQLSGVEVSVKEMLEKYKGKKVVGILAPGWRVWSAQSERSAEYQQGNGCYLYFLIH